MTTKKFNLQPWRVKQRDLVKKQFFGITAAVVIAVSAVLAANYMAEKKYIEQQLESQNFLEKEISGFKKANQQVELIKKLNKELNIQIDTVEDLQSKRSFVVEMLDFIAVNTPPGVFLTKISYDGSQLVFSGVAENEKTVASFLRSMNNFHSFEEPTLTRMAIAVSNGIYSVSDDTEVRTFDITTNVVIKDDNKKKN